MFLVRGFWGGGVDVTGEVGWGVGEGERGGGLGSERGGERGGL